MIYTYTKPEQRSSCKILLLDLFSLQTQKKEEKNIFKTVIKNLLQFRLGKHFWIILRKTCEKWPLKWFPQWSQVFYNLIWNNIFEKKKLWKAIANMMSTVIASLVLQSHWGQYFWKKNCERWSQTWCPQWSQVFYDPIWDNI